MKRDPDIMPERGAGAALAHVGFEVERHIADTMSAAHWHNHVEMNLLLDGHMTYLFNGRQEHVEAGRLVLFWAAIPHQTIDVARDAPLICAYVPLADFLDLPLDRETRQSVMRGDFLRNPRPDGSDIVAAERWVNDWQSSGEARRRLVLDEVRLRVRRLVLDGFSASHVATSAKHTRSAGNGGQARHAEALAEFINLHFAEPLSLKRVAEGVGIHPSTANSAFRRVLGLSVNEYIIRYRLARAMQRLADTGESILQIAFDCGFGSSSQFYEVFKLRVGLTPRQFRAANERENAG